MSTVQVEITGEAKRAETALAKVENKNAALNKRLRETEKRAKESDRQLRELGERGAKSQGKLEAKLEATNKALAEMERRYRQLEKHQRSGGGINMRPAASGARGAAAGGMGGSFSDVRGLLGPLATVASFGVAINALTKQLEARRDFAGRQIDENITLEAAERGLARNLPGLSVEEKRAIQERGKGLASDVGLSPQIMLATLADAFSASGLDTSKPEDVDTVFDAVRASAEFLKDDPEKLPAFAGSVLDLMKVTGSRDAYTNLGLMARISGMSRVTNPQSQAMSIPSTLLNALPHDAGAGEIAAVFSAITGGSGDFTGLKAGSATIGLAKQSKEFFEREGLTKAFTEAYGEGPGLADRIAMLQEDPALARKFLEESSFEKKGGGAIQELLTNADAPVVASYFNALEGMKDFSTLSAEGRQAIEDLNRVPSGAIVADMSRRATTFASDQAMAGNDADVRMEMALRAVDAMDPGVVSDWRKYTMKTGTQLRNEMFGPENAIAGLETHVRGDIGMTAMMQKFGMPGLDDDIASLKGLESYIQSLTAVQLADGVQGPTGGDGPIEVKFSQESIDSFMSQLASEMAGYMGGGSSEDGASGRRVNRNAGA